MKSKKVLLINSYVRNKKGVTSKMVGDYYEEPYPSVGLLYIAATLIKNNYDVFYLDIPAIIKQELIKENGLFNENDIDGLVEQILVETYNGYKPDIAGIDCLFSGKFSGVIFISSGLKKINKSLPIVIGGGASNSISQRNSGKD